jgi:hypothetical protein
MPTALDDPRLQNRRFRLAGAGIAISGLVIRLVLSAFAFGTNDVRYFTGFARVIKYVGPIAIYRYRFQTPYNHPPLVGYMLMFVNRLTSWGLRFPFALRLFPILADVAAAVLVMRVVRRYRGERSALVAGACVAFSPVLILVSAVHGNFDTVFCVLILLSLYLMVEKRWPAVAGVAVAVAVGIKLVSVVALPVVLLSARNRRAFVQFAGAFVFVTAAIWLPSLLREFHSVVKNVIGYHGGYGRWGVEEFATMAGVRRHTLSSVRGIMGWVALGVAMAGSVWYLLRTRHRSPYAAVGLALALLLLLLPAWGAQYMSWPAVLVLFISTGLAWWYSIAAGVFLFVVYSSWSTGGFPWHNIRAVQLDAFSARFGVAAWVLLAACVAYALVRARLHPERALD